MDLKMKYLQGTTYYDPAKCYNGYTLWSPMPRITTGAEKPWQTHGTTYLMDMHGKVVHQWDLPYPTMYCYLLPNGHLLAGLVTTESYPGRPGFAPFFMGGGHGILAEFDWDGKLLWEHKDLVAHHDFRKLPNGNIIYLAWEKLDKALVPKIRGGIIGSEHADQTVWVDIIREITPEGKVVYEWHAKDHLDFEKDIIGVIHKRDEWSHFNDLWVCPNGDMICSSRHCDCVFKISRETGEIVWRWGSPCFVDENGVQYTEAGETLGGPHHAHIIPEGLPGAGHMLCYDNGMFKYVSRALEVDMDTNEVVWKSTVQTDYGHGRLPFSTHVSSAERMPNGNTVICEGAPGHFYEVTMDHEVVWEWWRTEPDTSITPWVVFRCHRYGKDFCPQMATLPAPEGEAIL